MHTETMQRRYKEIHDRTGFDLGELFETEEQVREYFSVGVLEECLGEEDGWTAPDQATLDGMAEDVIEHGWHMAPPLDARVVESLPPALEGKRDLWERRLHDAGIEACWWVPVPDERFREPDEWQLVVRAADAERALAARI